MSKPKNPETIAAANGVAADAAFGAVTPPIVLSSTFTFAGFEQKRAHDYSRAANPTREMLADTLAKLEGGSGAVVVSSGMAAVDLVLSQLARNDLIVAPMIVMAAPITCSPLEASVDNSRSLSSIKTTRKCWPRLCVVALPWC